ncbi:MAG: hypothetical protein ACK5LE_01170 [Alphaproteobacteria bacterium]
MHNPDTIQKNSANQDNLHSPEEIANRLESAVDKLINAQKEYKQEINLLNGKIETFEQELIKAKILQEKLEKRVFALIERLRGLVEKEDI